MPETKVTKAAEPLPADKKLAAAVPGELAAAVPDETAAAMPEKPTEEKSRKEESLMGLSRMQEAPTDAMPAGEKAAQKPAGQDSMPRTTLTVEFLGRQYASEDIVEKALTACRAFYTEPIETFDVYFKAGVNEVYYVVNGKGSPDFKITI